MSIVVSSQKCVAFQGCGRPFVVMMCFLFLADMSPVRWQRRRTSSTHESVNCYNVTDRVVVTGAPAEKGGRYWSPQRRKLSKTSSGCSSPINGSCSSRERRNPLLDRVKHTRLSCFKSSETISQPEDSSGSEAGSTAFNNADEQDDDCRGLLPFDTSSLKEDLPSIVKASYRTSMSSSVGGLLADDVEGEDDVFQRQGVEERTTSEVKVNGVFRGNEVFSASKSNENVVYLSNQDCVSDCVNDVDVDRCVGQVVSGSYATKSVIEPAGKPAKNRWRSRTLHRYESQNSTSCLSAKLRAMSEKYLKSSTSKFLAKLYRNNQNNVAGGEEDGKSKKSKPPAKAKLRSFSYGALPGLEEFQRRHNPLYHEEDDDVDGNVDDDEAGREAEDGDSGIVNDSASSSILDDNHRSSLRSDSVNSNTKGYKSFLHLRSASQDQSKPANSITSQSTISEDLTNSYNDDSTDVWNSSPDSLASGNDEGIHNSPRRDGSLDTLRIARRRDAQRMSAHEELLLELTEKQRRRQRTSSCNGELEGTTTSTSTAPQRSPPPAVPTRGESSPRKTGASRRDFKVVRLERSDPGEGLGIFIAKTRLSDQGSPGYLIAHIVPEGLADR